MERSADLDLIRASLRPASQARLVVLEGEAGVGKTTMLRLAAQMARRDGGLVLHARGSELESELPFGIALQLLEPALREPRGRALLDSGAARLAAPLFGDGLPAEPVGSALPAIRGLFSLLCALAERSPMAILVDDAQWADDASLQLLLYLSGRLGDLRGLVLVASRPTDEPLLARLREQPESRTTRLRPLSRGATEQVVASVRPVSADLVSACHETTRGNPLYLVELLAELDRLGATDPPDVIEQVHAIGPEPVARRARRTLAALGDPAERVAHALLTLGDRTGVHLLAAQADLEEEAAATAVADLAHAGLVDDHDPPSFVHPIVATALRSARHPVESAGDHRRAAAVLRAAGAPPSRQATHLLKASPAASAETVETLRAAAVEAAGLGAPQVAFALLDRAIAEPPPPAEHAAVVRERARAAAAAGRPDAPELLAEAAEHSDEPERSRLAVEQASAHYAAGNFRAAARTAQAALDAEPPAEVRDELDAAWASAILFAGETADGVLEHVRRIMAVEPAGKGARRQALACQLAGLEMMRGDHRDRVAGLARRAWDDGRLLDRLAPDDPALWAVTGALLAAEEYATLDVVVGAIDARAERSGMLLTRASCAYVEALGWWQRGDLRRAAGHAQVVLDARRIGWEMYWAALLWIHASLLLEAGETEAARGVVSLPAAEEERLAVTPMIAGLYEVRGRLALAAGQTRVALEHFRRQGEIFEDRMGCRNPSLLGWRANAAIALGRLGDRSQARELIEEELGRAVAFGAPRAHGRVLRCAGLVAGGDDGVELLREAVGVLAPASARLEYAQALVDLGASLRALGHRVEARTPLSTGLAVADEAGASALADRARAELRTVGVHPRRAQLTGVAALTPAERRVAELVASGLTNRATAEALFVTLKAVEHHLSRVYRKLGVPRTGLSGALAPERERTLG